MTVAFIAILAGLALLVWSADLFVDGAVGTARHFGMPPLLIGMVIVGFGTSAPELVVSGLASLQGNPAVALGNAYGSNITNIALIVGVTALISPIAVHSTVLHKELPILIGVTLLAGWQVWDGQITRLDALVLLVVFAALMAWSIREGLRQGDDSLGQDVEQELALKTRTVRTAIIRLVVGLVLLVISSRVLVWGAIEVAQTMGVSDLVIGLTIVAVGTSLPELASSIMAVRKGENDIALGNVIGSNLFNTLAVVGIAAGIHPLTVGPEVFSRDLVVMGALTVLLFLFCYGFRGPGRINRYEAGTLLAAYVGYIGYLMATAF